MGQKYSETVKDMNLNTIYHLIRKGKDVSRASLVKDTGLSATSIGRSVGELIENGFIEERNQIRGNIGRQPIMLSVVSDSILVVGVNITSDRVLGSCIDVTGAILCRAEAPLMGTSVPVVVEAVKAAIDSVLSQLPDALRQHIVGVGISVPCGANFQTGKVVHCCSLGWNDVNLAEILGYYYPWPLVVDDYTKGVAKAFYYLGFYGGNYHDFLVWNLGDELNIAQMTGGRIYRGKDNLCGDIGNIVVEPNGVAYDRGPRGCLNALVGKRSLERRLSMSFAEALEQYRQGAFGRVIEVEKALDTLSEWMAVLMVMFCPPVMILSGSMIDESKLLYDLLKFRFSRYMGNEDEAVASQIVCSPIEGKRLQYISPAMNVLYKMVIHGKEVQIQVND
ncbi:MAG TPA: ROK family protein [Candidatus Pullichristensenella stercorigallinarum]|uniref:ROK family protein n=1 Tax=Candidatus Pullichristensenella stercorigallinarum TaxID=2840909 RepID=A0A9D0ZP64_9FIRM|nr:ROK family protein [Candidatus Pullichristensenella stercorigallinarum]